MNSFFFSFTSFAFRFRFWVNYFDFISFRPFELPSRQTDWNSLKLKAKLFETNMQNENRFVEMKIAMRDRKKFAYVTHGFLHGWLAWRRTFVRKKKMTRKKMRKKGKNRSLLLCIKSIWISIWTTAAECLRCSDSLLSK